MTFKPGQSGNPAGRPRGAKDKRNELRALFAGRSQALVDKCIEMALDGDRTAMRLCIDRLVAPIRGNGEAIKFPLPRNGKAADVILKGVAAGRISPDVGASLLQSVASHKAAVEVDALIDRIEALERREKIAPVRHTGGLRP